VTCAVFLGPTLPVDEARRILPDADFLPPAAQGSVLRALARRPRALGIIDGTFESEPSVWHKEILFALASGVRVFGSSSMGALRAAETCAFGTEGVGQIFAWYRDGVLNDDDDVAVAHGTATDAFRPLSVAQVNVQWGLAAARDRGLLAADAAEALVARSKARFYPDRCWPAVLDDARALGLEARVVEQLTAFLVGEAPDLKATDARALLARMAAERAAGWPPGRAAAFDFEATSNWHILVDNETTVRPGGGDVGDVSVADIHEHVIVGLPARDEVRRTALDLMFVDVESARLALDERHGPLGYREKRDLIDARQEGRGRHYYVKALRELGLLDGVLEAIDAKRKARQRAGLGEGAHTDDDVAAPELARWYASRFDATLDDPDREAQRLGMRSGYELLRALAAQYHFEVRLRGDQP
jgi:hypothetical protein